MKLKNGVYIAAEVLTPIVVVLLVLWFTNAQSNFFLPPLQDVVGAFVDNWLFALVPSELLPSLFRLFTGYLMAVVLGVGVGILIG